MITSTIINPSIQRLFRFWLFILLVSGTRHHRTRLESFGFSSQGVVVSAFSTTPSPPSGGDSKNVVGHPNNKDNNNNNNGKYSKENYSWLNTRRGARYESLNSTVPTATEAAMKVGVEPPLNVSAQAWKRAWTIHRTATPLLHKFDKLEPPDSKLNLMCLWWKALSGLNRKSPVFDNKLHYDMLPSVSRKFLRGPLRKLYPRLHHSNVEIRTAYLDQAVTKAIDEVKSQNKNAKIRLISMGAGYDLRSIKFQLEAGNNKRIDKAYELDLPDVIDSKTKLLKERLQTRRPDEIADGMLPKLYKVDLNHVETFESILKEILGYSTDDGDDNDDWHTIFLFEAVMIYLEEGVPTQLLNICRNVSQNSINNTTLVFADRLENIPGADLEIAIPVLKEIGWEIVEWSPKPGLARHMGMLLPL